MAKLGILGGMGPESTLEYYKKIVYQYEKRKHAQIFPNINIESIDIFSMLTLCQQKRYSELTKMLAKGIDSLYQAGATVALMAANTPHIVFEGVQRKSPIPLISIVSATLEKVQQNQQITIGLLGTEFTMTEKFFVQPFQDAGIKVVLPPKAEIPRVNSYIVNELEQGIIKESTKHYLKNVVANMIFNNHIEGLILGCTEIPLILSQLDFDISVYDTTPIHVDQAIDYLLQDERAN